MSELQEPTNHFAGAAEAYARFRADYPDAVWALLAREVELGSSSAILELGCGPGTATIGLAGRAASVTAVDLDADMLAEGQRVAARVGISNVRWVRAAAEDFDDTPGRYALVVVASAFHWMDRTRVAAKSHTLLCAGGALAVVDNPTPLMQIRARQGVGAAITEVQDRWSRPSTWSASVDSTHYRGNVITMPLARSRITSQGQISVPAEVRKKLGVGPGALLEWDEDEGKVVVRRVGTFSCQDMQAALFPDGPPKRLSSADIKASIGRHMKAKHVRR